LVVTQLLILEAALEIQDDTTPIAEFTAELTVLEIEATICCIADVRSWTLLHISCILSRIQLKAADRGEIR
jgi:hypothetical protein